MSSFQLGDKISTGSWDIYYHDPLDTKWSPDSYQKLGTIHTWADFFAMIKELGDVSIQQGMIFYMREGITPLYENHANIRGGCYSIRISRPKATRYFMIYTLATMLGSVVEDKQNIIQGISISPKRIIEKNQSFNVIKIWNKDSTNFNKCDQLIRLENVQQCSEIMYTPHIQKKL